MESQLRVSVCWKNIGLSKHGGGSQTSGAENILQILNILCHRLIKPIKWEKVREKCSGKLKAPAMPPPPPCRDKREDTSVLRVALQQHLH